MFERTSSVMVSITRVERDRSRLTAKVGSRSRLSPSYTSRCRNPVRYNAASRRVFDGTHALIAAAPPGRALRSTIATRLPKYAAWAAPFSPAGPVPMTTSRDRSQPGQQRFAILPIAYWSKRGWVEDLIHRSSHLIESVTGFCVLMVMRPCGSLLASAVEERVGGHDKRAGSDLAFGDGLQDTELQPLKAL